MLVKHYIYIICIHIHTHICVCVCICMYMYMMYMYVYVYIYMVSTKWKNWTVAEAWYPRFISGLHTHAHTLIYTLAHILTCTHIQLHIFFIHLCLCLKISLFSDYQLHEFCVLWWGPGFPRFLLGRPVTWVVILGAIYTL